MEEELLGVDATGKVEARATRNRDYFLSPRIAFDAKPYTDPGTLSLELTSDVLAAP